jgi:hypothetical protein
MAFVKKQFTPKKAAPEFRLMGTSMFACVFPENMQQERTFERKDGSGSFTRPSQYSIDVVLNPKSLEHAKKLGLEKNIRTPDEYHISQGYKGPFISFTRLETLPDGTPMKPPVVTDSFGEPQTEFIGNGSSVEVVFNRKEGKNFDKYGYNIYLKEVIVRELVEYKKTEAEPTTTPQTGKPAKQGVIDTGEAIFDDEPEAAETAPTPKAAPAATKKKSNPF